VSVALPGGPFPQPASADGSCGTRGRLAQRFAPTVDRIRQRTVVRFGLRVYDVSLVWTRWNGRERGEGDEVEIARVPIVPRPMIEDLSTVNFNPFAAGLLPQGAVRISQITTRLTADNLLGLTVPPKAYFDGCGIVAPGISRSPEALALSPAATIGHSPPTLPSHIREPHEFFFEITEDVPGSWRSKYRRFSNPFRRPGKFDWSIVVERISEDRDRHGRSQIGVDS
jgi:hypothetical protein